MDKKYKTMYSHTLNGKPAAWDESGKYLYFVGEGPNNYLKLEKDIKTIRRQQQKDLKDSLKYGYPPCSYGYVKVKVPV